MPLTDADREALIRSAVDTAKSNGIKLNIQSWGVSWSDKKERWLPNKGLQCCALGCVILAFQDKLPRKTDWRSHTVAAILECDTSWIDSFQRGFDGYPKSQYDDCTFAYELGFLLSSELVTKDAQIALSNM